MKKMGSKKQLGQNFLTRDHFAQVMCEAAEITPSDTVVEIGPGKGILTKILLTRAGKVLAIEKDGELVLLLQNLFQKEIAEGKLDLIENDVRDIAPAGTYKVVANIPYYITGEILRKFLSAAVQPSSMTLMVQKEVAERILARDGKESLLSLSVKSYGEPQIVARVPAGNFYPKPKVDSAILHIRNISRDFFGDVDEKKFFEVLHAGFAHKRKQLAKNLERFGKEKVSEVLHKQHLPLTVRAEDVPLKEWKEIAKEI